MPLETACYCWANGELAFGGRMPRDALPVVKAWKAECGIDHARWRATIVSLCRRSYDGGVALVPGIPESGHQMDALAALERFQAIVEAALAMAARNLSKP
jgi:hypothetical protein